MWQITDASVRTLVLLLQDLELVIEN